MTDLLNSRYHLLEVLGQGSMGVVWRALDTVLDREVAIKELRPGQGVDPAEARDRFLVEARAAAKLSHPNIVAVHDVFSDGDRVLITMELVAGPTLAQVVSGSGPQSAEVVRAVMAQVAQALAGAHGAGVVHRDLKPENIFWTPQGRAVVADFGLARIGAGRGTMEGTVMGTPGYMAPEQVRGMVVGPAADVFAWGAVAFELATGQAPFGEATATDPSALAYRIVHQDPPPLDMPTDPALAELITRAMAKDPDERPADGAALVSALGGFPGGRVTAPSRPPAARPHEGSGSTAIIEAGRPKPARFTTTALVGTGVALVLLVVVVTVAAIAGQRPDGSDSVRTKPATPLTTAPWTLPPTTRSTVPPTTTTTLPPNVLFKDDFSNQRGWTQSESENVSYKRVNGEYRIASKIPGFIHVATAPNGASLSGVRVQTDARFISGEQTRMGLVCRRGSGANQGAYYSAQVDRRGYWIVVRNEGQATQILASARTPAEHTAALKPSEFNHISLECAGLDSNAGSLVRLRFSVNSTKVADLEDASGLASGDTGLTLGASNPTIGEVGYDNFLVTRL